MALWLIPILYVAGTLCFGIVFLRFEHEYLVEHKSICHNGSSMTFR